MRAAGKILRTKKVEKDQDFIVDKCQWAGIMRNMIIEKVRKRIEKSGKSLNQIGRDTGIDKAALSRVMRGRDCTTQTADLLLKYFGLTIAKKGRKKVR
jgi:uncharacterized protein YerC